MMKTIKEYLDELEEPYRSQAFENVKTLNIYPEGILESNMPNKPMALMCAFVFIQSKEGNDYWINVLNTFN